MQVCLGGTKEFYIEIDQNGTISMTNPIYNCQTLLTVVACTEGSGGGTGPGHTGLDIQIVDFQSISISYLVQSLDFIHSGH